ncbi:MAG: hypothetical protein AB7E77_10580, partial [Desulfobulbus sp.]
GDLLVNFRIRLGHGAISQRKVPWFFRKVLTIGRLDKNSKAAAQAPAKKGTCNLAWEKGLLRPA